MLEEAEDLDVGWGAKEEKKSIAFVWLYFDCELDHEGRCFGICTGGVL